MSYYMERDNIVLDSSFLIAYFCKDDSLHEKAKIDAINLENKVAILTSGVIHEVSNLLIYRKEYVLLDLVLKSFLQSGAFVILDSFSFLEVETYLRNSNIKNLSYTDVSLLFYSKYKNATVLTYDKKLISFIKNSN